jgi:hypothetical protein
VPWPAGWAGSRSPASPATRASPAEQAHVVREIEAAALRDPAFARELTALVAQLDRSGGRRLINSVRAQVNVQAFEGGYAHYGNYYEGDAYTNDYDPGDELVAGRGIGRFVAIIGLTVTLAGFLGVAAVIYDAFQNGSPGSSPLNLEIVPGIPLLPVGFLALFCSAGFSTGWAPRRRKPHASATSNGRAAGLWPGCCPTLRVHM